MSLSIQNIDFEDVLGRLFPLIDNLEDLSSQDTSEQRIKGVLTEMNGEKPPSQELFLQVVAILSTLGVKRFEINSEAMLLAVFGNPTPNPQPDLTYYNPRSNWIKAIITKYPVEPHES